MKVNILTDSTADLTKELINEHDIKVYPLNIYFGEEEYIDGVTINHREFFDKLAVCKELPTTSQIAVGKLKELFIKYTDNNEEVVVITLSSKLSGSFNSAVLVRESLEEERKKRVHLIDSMSVTLGLCNIVLEACKLRDKGLNASEIETEINRIKNKSTLIALIEDYKYLVMGGRLSKATAFMGSTLNIMPVVEITGGEVVPIKKVRGKKKGYQFIIDKAREYGIDTSKAFFMGHIDDKEAYESFSKYMFDNFEELKDIDISPVKNIGAVVGTHAGPHCVGIAFFKKN
ncbi:DegV family protein [Anaerofustis sp.]|uniref:DegV family protein n=1 Tax=Anaerofustis sp. TaxID=1872517 RepID=UPI0025BD5303|nr:DegV family protein [Anaerofustis sp.]